MQPSSSLNLSCELSVSGSMRRGSLDPGQLELLQRKTIVAAQENRMLQDELLQGRRLIGEYHAQITLDHIRQENEIARLQGTLEAMDASRNQLEERLTFLFHDCQRLARDNAKISANFGKSDAELAELRRTLVLQEKKNADSKVNLGRLRDECVKEEREFARMTEELREAQRGKEKLKLQQWEMRDEEDQLEGAAELLQQEMLMLQKRPHGTKRRRESLVTAAGGGGAPKAGVVDASAGLASQRDVLPAGRGKGVLPPLERCERPDCAYFRRQFELLEEQVLARHVGRKV